MKASRIVFGLVALGAAVLRHHQPAPGASPVVGAAVAADAPALTADAGPWSKGPAPVSAASFAPPTSAEPRPLSLARDASGHFELSGEINGHPAPFLIDTGADLVSIPQEQAAGYGIAVDPASFRPILRTASGTGMGAVVHIDRLDVAGVTLHDVDAVVAQGLNQLLLGQSALRHLGKVSLEGDTMVIAPTVY